MTLPAHDSFGTEPERKNEWCLLGVTGDGHPKFMCTECRHQRLVKGRGEALPSACPRCKTLLTPRPVTLRVAHGPMIRAGHQNLIGAQGAPGDD